MLVSALLIRVLWTTGRRRRFPGPGQGTLRCLEAEVKRPKWRWRRKLSKEKEQRERAREVRPSETGFWSPGRAHRSNRLQDRPWVALVAVHAQVCLGRILSSCVSCVTSPFPPLSEFSSMYSWHACLSRVGVLPLFRAQIMTGMIWRMEWLEYTERKWIKLQYIYIYIYHEKQAVWQL